MWRLLQGAHPELGLLHGAFVALQLGAQQLEQVVQGIVRVHEDRLQAPGHQRRRVAALVAASGRPDCGEDDIHGVTRRRGGLVGEGALWWARGGGGWTAGQAGLDGHSSMPGGQKAKEAKKAKKAALGA